MCIYDISISCKILTSDIKKDVGKFVVFDSLIMNCKDWYSEINIGFNTLHFGSIFYGVKNMEDRKSTPVLIKLYFMEFTEALKKIRI